MNKFFKFLKALMFHIGAGFPKSSQKQINERYSICKSCEYYENDQCLVCGCNVNNNRVFLNKLAWADQSCPIHKWEKISV